MHSKLVISSLLGEAWHEQAYLEQAGLEESFLE
jgi:hypothetical protein